MVLTIVEPELELIPNPPLGRTLPTMETVWFRALDGHWLNFKHLLPAPEADESRGPVILVHGTGVRANLFFPPTDLTLPAMLAGVGFDVWVLNWRSSIDLRPIEWTLDDAAVLDYPRAVEVILQETGAETLKAIIHCQGSCSFMMSMLAGLLPQVTAVVANSSGLHLRMRWMARIKLPIAMLVFGRWVKWFDPQFGLSAPTFAAKLMDWIVRAFHHECQNAVCKHSSFVYGFGFPTMWKHDNLSDATHDWLDGEFAHAPVKLFKQIRRCVARGRLVTTGEYGDVLPTEFGLDAPGTDAIFHFVTGAENQTFLPKSMKDTYDYFSEYSNKHTFHEFRGYGHMDVLIGENAAQDVFPYMIEKLAETPCQSP
jgi:hypothetical protein